MSGTNTYPRTIAIDHIMVTLQLIMMLGKVLVGLRGSKIAVMTHGIAEIEDFGDEVRCSSCHTDRGPLN